MPAYTFDKIMKYNHNHDASGRFSSSPGAGGGTSGPMGKIREHVKSQDDKTLLQTWGSTREDTSTEGIAVNSVLETELEERGLIRLNEDTFEYEVVNKPEKTSRQKEPAAPKNTNNKGASLTEGQSEYFKDSKARDEDGNLLVLYHNTDAKGIETFRTQTESGYGGLYMSDTESVATGYGGGTTHKLYADLKNPLTVDAGGKAYDSIMPPEGMGRKYTLGSNSVDTQAIAAYARDNGYDGVIVNNVKEPTGHGTDVIVFNPNQVKSIENKNPSRDANIHKAATFSEVMKFNPHHGPDGKFSNADGAVHFTTRTKDPSKQHWADNAVARAKQQSSTGSTGGSTSKYSQEEKTKAIEDWSDGGYGHVRRAQRSKDPDPRRKRQADAIEEHIKEQPDYGGELFRGISTDESVSFRRGQNIDMNGASSWSKDEEVAQEFATGEMAHGEHAYIFTGFSIKNNADVSGIAMNPNEKEVIVSNDTKFTVMDVVEDKQKNLTYVVVEGR